MTERGREGRGLSRRHVLAAGALAAAGVGLGATPAQAAPFRIATQAQHQQLSITWGYPFSSRVLRRLGVDGYPGEVYAGHSGVDYFATPRVGTTIHAVADGIVTEVSNPLTTEVDLGQFVRISHAQGMYSSYGHMTPGSTRVALGQEIPRGYPLGATGWSGRVVPKDPSTGHLHLTIYSEPGRDPVIWNPVWLVDTAALPEPAPIIEDDDMPFLVRTHLGHVYTVGTKYIRHETSMSDVTFLQTVYSRLVTCRDAAQFRAITNSLSIPEWVPETLRSNGGGRSWSS